MEEGPLYQAISTGSQKFVYPPFNITSGQAPLQGLGTSQHSAAAQITVLACPSFAGDRVAGPDKQNNSASPYTGNAAGALNGGQGCAISNYHACAGTHIDNSSGNGNNNTKGIHDNGALQFRGTGFDKGRGLSAMAQDGTSKTAEVVETREQAVNCWIDGTVVWVVAARQSQAPNGASVLTPAATLAANTAPPVNGVSVAGRWVVPTTTGGHGLNVGPTVQYPAAFWMPAATCTSASTNAGGPNIAPARSWGPSSNHSGGIINHVCGDGHVAAISESTDPNVYLWFYTRNGGEPTTPEN
jgi:hypothetical protein